ncbi:mannonate dehydratase [Enterococcus lactis]|uniref:mannonate dehydratase n=1 Tax=Enterococcus lactis TaxID=357441 RepID=UPI00321F64DB
MKKNELFRDWEFRYRYVYLKRRTKKSKQRFLSALVSDIYSMRTDVTVIAYDTPAYRSKNIYVGDIEKAEKVICTYYDTPVHIQTIKNLSRCGVRLICYSFKPIFGWAKTDLFNENNDGSYSLLYDQKIVNQMEPGEMYQLIHSQSKGFKLPGWEEERLKKFAQLEKLYEGMTEEELFENLTYFLGKVIPVCEKADVKMAIHPDDPPWELFGFPRVTKNLGDLKKILNAVDSPYNGLTLCTGSLGANPKNDLVEIIHEVGSRIHFVHFRNVEFLGERKFKETAHPSTEGSLDMHHIMKALVQEGFEGPIRPDHGRTVWGEVAMPGYGLYDRAMGLTYMQGLYEAISKEKSLGEHYE